ncbi:hypothetical protein GIB67_037007 [Kingdonia uniflora]|uniref:Cation/H+ exchanger transmembrane domain-containing protein n=1 Tax=Kingdonia uniflora TaxID=39325 RepID=A0A7J7LHS1_9MAGN|nr:hypothetical protein GIB67_037007 [Kingdonia uniflora]
MPRNISRGKTLLSRSNFCWGSSYTSRRGHSHWRRFRIYAELDVASAVDVINDLGFDTLTFLAVTVIIVPVFKFIKASPILGFFFSGVVLNQFGLIRNLTDVKVLSEWGILFLLFEMGLELSLARLKALAKFAFGMGLTQVYTRRHPGRQPPTPDCQASSVAPGLPPAIDSALSGIEPSPTASIPVTTDDDLPVSHSDDDRPIVLEQNELA